MQALLSYEQSPPLAAPFRFFLTAPCCGVLAGLLLIVYGEDALVMRWTPAALALTHAVTAGFMLQAMLGALIQILPVVVGVNLAAPGALARRVHALSILGLAALGRPLQACVWRLSDWRLPARWACCSPPAWANWSRCRSSS